MDALYGWSYENLLLLARAAPGYGAGGDGGGEPGFDPSLAADSPEAVAGAEAGGAAEEEETVF